MAWLKDALLAPLGGWRRRQKTPARIAGYTYLQHQLVLLQELSRAMIFSMEELKATLDLITSTVTTLLQVERSHLYLVDERRQCLVAKAASGIIDREMFFTVKIPLGQGCLGLVAQTGEPAMVDNAAEDFRTIKSLVDKFKTKSLIVVPLKARGRVLGVIAADSKISREPFMDEDLELLKNFANLAAVAVDNAQMHERERQKTQRLYALFEIGTAMISTLRLEDLLNLIIDKAIEVMQATSGSLMLIDKENQRLIIRSARGLAAEVVKTMKLKVGEGVTGWVAKTGQPSLVADASQDTRYVVAVLEVRSELAVPMILHGETIGVINVDHTELAAFTPEDQELLMTLANLATVAIRNAQLFEELQACQAQPG